jgi:hypothetical protein
LTKDPLAVRAYGDGDERGVLDLLDQAFGGWPVVEGTSDLDPIAFFRWKHLQSPFGRSVMAVAERDGELVGFRAFMPWLLRAGQRSVRGLRTADAATAPELQRAGVFGNIRREADRLFGEPVDVHFGTPNTLSLGATMKLGGRSVAGTLPVWTRMRPARAGVALLRRRNGRPPEARADPAASALAGGGPMEELLREAGAAEPRLATVKDTAWLRWRYADVPLDYRAVTLEEHGRLRGLALFRLRTRRSLPEAVIEELFVAPGDNRAAGRILRDVSRVAPVALCSCCFPTGTAQRRAAVWNGFVRWRGGSTIVVKNTDGDVHPPPAKGASWALTLGDLELV